MPENEKTEFIEGPSIDSEPAWERAVWQRYRNKCANCGNPEHLRVRLVVPPEAGGQMVESNGVLLCRSCEMASEAAVCGTTGSEQRLVNFWVSRRLFDRIQLGLKTYNAFNSMGALVRYLIAKYIEDENRFEDLNLYQDDGADVKLNVWVERDAYNVFKVLLDKRGMTVTDALKSLIVLYESDIEPSLALRKTTTSENAD
jgi:hypothetical protein